MRKEPPIRAVQMTLFPTMSSLQEVLDYASSKLPIKTNNELYSVLMTFQNTLLKEINSGKPPQ